MVVRGRVVNGVVILEENVRLPEGTAVTVQLEGVDPAGHADPARERIFDAERRRVLEIIDRIAALPIEGKTDPFGGADHDKVLYGNPG